ncbi:MAG: hypothetical protein Fur009_6900 [Candidatus Microgenomates bacterium]
MTEKGKEEKIKKLFQEIFQYSYQQNLEIASVLSEKLSSEPQDWLWEEVARRGQEVLVDKMPVSEAMIREFRKKHPQAKEAPKTVAEWLEAMGIKKDLQQARIKLRLAEQSIFLNEAQEKIYQELEGKISKTLQEIAKEQAKVLSYNKDGFPSYPLTQDQLTTIIDQIVNQESISEDDKQAILQKLQAVYLARFEIAKKQQEHTELFLKTTLMSLPGGYRGWNEKVKGVMTLLFESSPYLISLFEEPNCVGRMILLSGMLMRTGVFDEKDLVVNNTYNHTFFGSFDALGLGRVIEGSGYPFRSVYGLQKKPIFQGEVFDEKQIIRQLPLIIGLLGGTGVNFSSHLESESLLRSKLFLLEKYGFLKDSLWNSLGFSLKSLNKLSFDWVLAWSRAASISNLFPHPFYSLLSRNDLFTKTALDKALENPNADDLTKQALSYIKLNLIVMQKALTDEENKKLLFERIRLLINQVEVRIIIFFNEQGMKNMKKNLYLLLESLKNTPLPQSFIDMFKKDNGSIDISQIPWDKLREYLWNPDNFPKPVGYDEEKKQVIWQMPEG